MVKVKIVEPVQKIEADEVLEKTVMRGASGSAYIGVPRYLVGCSVLVLVIKKASQSGVGYLKADSNKIDSKEKLFEDN